jgi:hypothetical protein
MATLKDGSSVPAALANVAPDTCRVWEAVAVHSKSWRVQARLHDLLFERRHGEVGRHAVGAAEAYLADGLSDQPPNLRTADALTRSHRLVKLTRKASLIGEVQEAIITVLDRCLEDPEQKPGVFLRLIEVLVDNRDLDPRVPHLLEGARARYAEDPFIVESIIELQRKCAPSDGARSACDRELVQLWLDEAARREPFVAVIFREKAAQLARERGLPDLVNQAVLELQGAGPLDLQRISVEVPLSTTREQLDEFIESMVGANWWASVERILAQGPPSGRIDANRQLATDLAKQAPLQSLFPTTKVGGDGLPRYTPSTDEDHAEDQLTEVELHHLHFVGFLQGEALRRAGERHSPSATDVAAALESIGCDGDAAAAIGRVLDRFHHGDFEGATYTALPLVERLCRGLLLAVDEPLYRVQRAKQPATYPGLGALLPALAERGLDPSWHRFLRSFLTAPNGMNFRNEALHGFVADVDDALAAIAMIGLLYVTHLRPGQVVVGESPDVPG